MIIHEQLQAVPSEMAWFQRIGAAGSYLGINIREELTKHPEIGQALGLTPNGDRTGRFPRRDLFKYGAVAGITLAGVLGRSEQASAFDLGEGLTVEPIGSSEEAAFLFGIPGTPSADSKLWTRTDWGGAIFKGTDDGNHHRLRLKDAEATGWRKIQRGGTLVPEFFAAHRSAISVDALGATLAKHTPGKDQQGFAKLYIQLFIEASKNNPGSLVLPLQFNS